MQTRSDDSKSRAEQQGGTLDEHCLQLCIMVAAITVRSPSSASDDSDISDADSPLLLGPTQAIFCSYHPAPRIWPICQCYKTTLSKPTAGIEKSTSRASKRHDIRTTEHSSRPREVAEGSESTTILVYFTEAATRSRAGRVRAVHHSVMAELMRSLCRLDRPSTRNDSRQIL